MKKILFLFSFFFLFSLITQPFSNVQAATKKSSFSTETSGNKTNLKGTGATPDSPGSNLTTTAVKQPTTAAPGKPGIGTGGNTTGTNSSSSSTTAAKKDDKKDDKTKVSDEGRKYPTEIDKPLEKVCYDMVCDTLNVTLGKTMKLQASITPEDATNKTLVYTSSDDTIASVKEDGTVSGLKLGTADITVKAMDTGKEKNVKVTVKEAEKEPANPTNPAKPSQPTTKTVKKGTKLTVGTNIFVVTNVKAKTVSYKGTKKKKVAKITIPATVKSGNQVYKVTAIADNAFKNNKKIKTVVVGKNVRTIGKKAFYGCKNLKKITVQSSIIKKVGAKAFKGINKKAVIKVPSKKYKAYKKVFKGKGQAKTVTIKK